MSIALLKTLRRSDAGVCTKCGHKLCDCRTSGRLHRRSNGKRGKRRFWVNEVPKDWRQR